MLDVRHAGTKGRQNNESPENRKAHYARDTMCLRRTRLLSVCRIKIHAAIVSNPPRRDLLSSPWLLLSTNTILNKRRSCSNIISYMMEDYSFTQELKKIQIYEFEQDVFYFF